MQSVRPSLFIKFASRYPQYWKAIEGCEVTHKYSGKGIITRVDLYDKVVIFQGRKVGLGFIRDEIFTGLYVPSEIAEKIFEFEEQEQKKTRLLMRRRLEKEKIEKEKLAEIERLRLEQSRQQEIKRAARLEAEKQSKIRAAQERARLIQEFCAKRGIENLVHFTRMENLSMILQKGLMSRKELSGLPAAERPIFNDHERLDGHTEAVCLSISFTNYQMFYKYNQNNPSAWCVLLLNPSILWDLDCAFCQANASSSAISRTPIEERKSYNSLVQMFSNVENVPRDNSAIPAYYPTNPQAEVLVFDTIPINYIRGVHFKSIAAMQNWQKSSHQPNCLSMEASSIYFTYRQDFREWQKPKDNYDEPHDYVNWQKPSDNYDEELDSIPF